MIRRYRPSFRSDMPSGGFLVFEGGCITAYPDSSRDCFELTFEDVDALVRLVERVKLQFHAEGAD